MLQIQPFSQKYAWGKKGRNSLVGKLLHVRETDQDTPYAELWMGTHPSGPNEVISTGESFLSWIRKNSALIGRIPDGYLNDDIPFLFKVLSIEKALSIQAHPDKALAKALHEQFPSLYKDSNHKPEMVIALTEFRCMCSFRKLEEILELSTTTFPEFAALLLESGYKIDDSSHKDLATLFSKYIKSDQIRVQKHLDALITRLQSKGSTSRLSLTEETVLLLHSQFPGDIGVFSPILLNCLVLNPGDSFFIGANEPHAYLHGDCIECMALSDNVVRAGLTEKHKDVDILCQMLNYQSGHPHWIDGVRSEGGITTLYRPPYSLCSEFAVQQIRLKKGQCYHLEGHDVSSMVLVVSGSVRLTCLTSHCSGTEGQVDAETGKVLFLAAGESIELVSRSDEEETLLFRAHVNFPDVK